MNLAQKVLAPLALSFTVVAGAVAAQDATNDNNNTQIFTCDMPGLSQVSAIDLATMDLPDRMEEIMPANVFIETGIDDSPGGGLGSGFIIDGEQGYILTNNHVIMGGSDQPADTITITFYDPNGLEDRGRSVEATLIGRDEALDLAVLQVEMDEVLPCVQLGNSDALRRGETVYPVGNPLGQVFSLSSGLVSAPDREANNPLYNYIQTDADINRGNSGGALFNDAGEVVGINTQILSPNGNNIGIGMAIKSNDIREAAEDIILWGEVKRAGLGIQIQEVDADTATTMNAEEGMGALITKIAPNRPAALGGLEEGDIILSVDGLVIHHTQQLVRKIMSYDPNDTINLRILRDGVEQDISLALTDRDAALQPMNSEPAAAPTPD